MDTGSNKETWGVRLMDLAMRYMTTQHVSKPSRVRRSDEPSSLDLIFKNSPNEIEMANYNCPLGKSDHMVPDFEVEMGKIPEEDESYRQRWYSYSTSNFKGLRAFFFLNVD